MGFHAMIVSNSKPKGEPIMETAERTELEALRALVSDLAAACTDASLLDLVCKLLAMPPG